MKKSCLLYLALWGGLSWTIYSLLHLGFSAPGIYFAAIFGGLFATLGIGAIFNTKNSLKLISLLRASRSMPQDGKMYAAVGTIHPQGQPLRAPFSGRECVAYDYKIESEEYSGGDSGTTSKSHYTGQALTPSTIRTQTGGVKLLGFPELTKFPSAAFGQQENIENAQRYVANTTFSDMVSLKKFGQVIKEAKELLNDDDGSVRKDWKTGNRDDFENLKLRETIVAVGAQVCAIGMFSKTKGGLVPDVSRSGSIVQLFPGTPEKAIKDIRGQMIVALIVGIIMLIFVVGGTYAAYLEQSNRISIGIQP